MDNANPEMVTVKDSKFGKGLFTTIELPKNTILFKITGNVLSFEQTLWLGKKECYSLQVGIDKYIIPDHPFYLSNHSCEPNCGINRNMEFITLGNVDKGEELVWDYSTSMLERHWTMQCRCGSSACRKIIKDFDQLPLDLQEKYLNMNIVLPYITEYLYGLPKIDRITDLQYS